MVAMEISKWSQERVESLRVCDSSTLDLGLNEVKSRIGARHSTDTGMQYGGEDNSGGVGGAGGGMSEGGGVWFIVVTSGLVISLFLVSFLLLNEKTKSKYYFLLCRSCGRKAAVWLDIENGDGKFWAAMEMKEIVLVLPMVGREENFGDLSLLRVNIRLEIDGFKGVLCPEKVVFGLILAEDTCGSKPVMGSIRNCPSGP